MQLQHFVLQIFLLSLNMELYKSILYEIITVRSYRDVNYKSMPL